MDGNSEQLQVINLKQLPIIEERLRDVKAKIEQRTSAVMALAVTEETRTDVKKIRTEVRKELEGYEAQRMSGCTATRRNPNEGTAGAHGARLPWPTAHRY